MYAYLCYNHTRSRAGTTEGGHLWWVWRSLNRRLLVNCDCRGSSLSYGVIYLVHKLYYVIKMWYCFLCTESSYMRNLILTHMWDASGFVLRSDLFLNPGVTPLGVSPLCAEMCFFTFILFASLASPQTRSLYTSCMHNRIYIIALVVAVVFMWLKAVNTF
jgi:hypothetical protein